MSEQHVWFCTQHQSMAKDEKSERCLKVLNAALRLGLNPFDGYNNERFGGKCSIVEAEVRVVPEAGA